MNKRLFSVGIIVFVVFLLIFLSFYLLKKESHIDGIKYKGKIYQLLEFKNDIFTYSFNSNEYYEQDEIHEIDHEKWDVIYFDGDLYILDSQVSNAVKYYSLDNNYNWSISFDNAEDEMKFPLNLNIKEMQNLYQLDDVPKNNAIFFEEIELFGSIVKESNDGFVFGIISLAKYQDNWHWKTEIMTEDNKEYMVNLLPSLNKKINKIYQDNRVSELLNDL